MHIVRKRRSASTNNNTVSSASSAFNSQARSQQPPSSMAGSRQSAGTDEDRGIATMMAQTSSHWEKSSDEMTMTANGGGGGNHGSASMMQKKMFVPKKTSSAGSLFGGGGGSGAAGRTVAPPPSNYTCFRCGQKGHYINACPTNDDPNFNAPRIKRTTGIPKTFLKPADSVASGNVMIAADGSLVAVEPHEHIWDQLNAADRAKTAAASNATPLPDRLACGLCGGCVREAVLTPCCLSLYCDECIRRWLMPAEESDAPAERTDADARSCSTKRLPPPAAPFTCPQCRTTPVSPDALIAAEQTRADVDAWLRGAQETPSDDRQQMPPQIHESAAAAANKNDGIDAGRHHSHSHGNYRNSRQTAHSQHQPHDKHRSEHNDETRRHAAPRNFAVHRDDRRHSPPPAAASKRSRPSADASSRPPPTREHLGGGDRGSDKIPRNFSASSSHRRSRR